MFHTVGRKMQQNDEWYVDQKLLELSTIPGTEKRKQPQKEQFKRSEILLPLKNNHKHSWAFWRIGNLATAEGSTETSLLASEFHKHC